MKNIQAILLFLLATINMYADEMLPIGNFALPMAQQPSPLFAFGQNVVDKNDFQAFDSIYLFKGRSGKKLLINELNFLYGIRDDLSLLISIPAPVINNENNKGASGFGDLIIQGEYAYINKETSTALTQATLVGSILLPTGIVDNVKSIPIPSHDPFTGFGSTSFFIGGTFIQTTIDWYGFISVGELCTTKQKCNTKLGNTTFYQTGIGRNLRHMEDKILLLALELDGIFSQKDRLGGVTDPNSGGNVIFVGPMLWYSTKKLIFQIGITAPIFQQLSGKQPKYNYFFACNIEWTFNHDE